MAIQRELTSLEKIRKEESDLKELGEEIERLRAAYERYFLGMERTEPWVHRSKMDRAMRLNETLGRSNRTTVRFRWNALVRKYQAYVRYWDRICRQIEEGTYAKDRIKALRRAGKMTQHDSPRARRRREREEALEAQKSARGASVTGEAAEEFLQQLGLAPSEAPRVSPAEAQGVSVAPNPAAGGTPRATLAASGATSGAATPGAGRPMPPPLPNIGGPPGGLLPMNPLDSDQPSLPPPLPGMKQSADAIRGMRASQLGRELQKSAFEFARQDGPSNSLAGPSPRQQTNTPPPLPGVPPASARPLVSPHPAAAPPPSAGRAPAGVPQGRNTQTGATAEFRELYHTYVNALGEVGKSPSLTYERFADTMSKKREAHSEKYSAGVTYSVAVKDGNVTITAKRRKDS